MSGTKEGKTLFTFEYDGETLIVISTKYQTGHQAVVIEDMKGLPYATLSVNLEGQDDLLEDGEFFAKTYSENTKIAQVVHSHFEMTNKSALCGHVIVPVWRVPLIDPELSA